MYMYIYIYTYVYHMYIYIYIHKMCPPQFPTRFQFLDLCQGCFFKKTPLDSLICPYGTWVDDLANIPMGIYRP